MIDQETSLIRIVEALLNSLDRWGVVAVFAGMFLDCLPFIAWLAPGIILVVLAGFTAANHSVVEGSLLFGSACLGVFTADTLMYFTGRLGYRRNATIRNMVEKRDKLRKEIVTQKTYILLFYQFPPLSRMFGPLIMGAAGFGLSRWFMLVALSTTVFVGAFFGLGLTAGLVGHGPVSATKAGSVVTTLFALAFFSWLVRLIVRMVRHSRKQKDIGG